MNITQIRDGVWEFREAGMNVPVRIYATEKLFKTIEEGVFKQAKNVSMLPGIKKASLVMPDGHYGYGFPIGGVAAFDMDEGIVSPGGVGYDINCLSGDSKVLHEFGFRRKIKEFKGDFEKQRIKCMNFGERVKDTKIAMFMESKKDIYEIETTSGIKIKASGDHPFYTPGGMVKLAEIENEKVAVFPFEGVDYKSPDDEILVSEKDIISLPHEKDKTQTIEELKKRGLLPLRANSSKLPYLLKIFGFVLGDGTLYFTGNKGTVWFYGEEEDLEYIREDIKSIGFTPSKIYFRDRQHEIETAYGVKRFNSKECSFKTTSSSFAALLWAMDLPAGKKVEKDFILPEWFSDLKLWQKRLFLASLFGAELSSPGTVTNHDYNFYGPVMSMNKNIKKIESGRVFLKQVKDMLTDFGVNSSIIKERKEYTNKRGEETHRLRLQISSDPENLIRLWSKIGYEYNVKRRHLANVAVQYLREKIKIIAKREDVEKLASKMRGDGLPASEIYEQTTSEHVNRRFIERSIYEGRKTSSRIPLSFPKFTEYEKIMTAGLGKAGMLWDTITKKSKIGKSVVYDFTVADKHHNFIANSFVVSNCGVRLLTTDLNASEVRPKLRNLIDNLFDNVPSGVGSKSKIRISESELCDVFVEGAKWAVENGYGVDADLSCMEENGSISGANPEKVGKRAMQRGRPQLGTLGSGNHFLEVQRVDKIFEPEIAKKFGIMREGQVTVMVHCGSRGVGHQIADDYIKIMLEAARKYNINLPDRELACAPVNSREAKDYLSAMYCAVNYAFANREIITDKVRETFKKLYETEIDLVYDVCHNIAKFEKHKDVGKVCVHRKGATRAFAAGREEIPEAYRSIGQPVIVPGDMGTASYVLIGTEKGMEETFGSVCHGAGRVMSRAAAKRKFRGDDVRRNLEAKGEFVRAASPKVLAEEVSDAYKDIDEVIRSVELAGISKVVARVTPMGVAKG